jgi:glycosyltransferase involved in cell wall biosynthesis
LKLLVDARVGWGYGIGRVIANTVPRISGLRPEWRIDVLVPPADTAAARGAFRSAANVTVVECPVAPFSLGEQVRLNRYAAGYDLTWFTNYWVPLGWQGPFVVTVHDMLHLIPDLFPTTRTKRALSRRTLTKVRRDARAVMFVSRFTEHAFGQMVGRPSNGVTIQLGGDHLSYGELRPVRDRSRRLLTVAAAKKHKNFQLLFDAWRAADVPDHWTLTVITPDKLLKSSVDVAQLAGEGGQIDIRRGVSDEALTGLYADSAVLLMPSLYEGFGLPLLEGMLSGALCVSSAAGAMVEVAEGAFVQFVNGIDRAGWTNAIEEACAVVDDDRIDLDTIARHNAAHAQRFTWDVTSSGIVRVIEETAP